MTHIHTFNRCKPIHIAITQIFVVGNGIVTIGKSDSEFWNGLTLANPKCYMQYETNSLEGAVYTYSYQSNYNQAICSLVTMLI